MLMEFFLFQLVVNTLSPYPARIYFDMVCNNRCPSFTSSSNSNPITISRPNRPHQFFDTNYDDKISISISGGGCHFKENIFIDGFKIEFNEDYEDFWENDSNTNTNIKKYEDDSIKTTTCPGIINFVINYDVLKAHGREKTQFDCKSNIYNNIKRTDELNLSLKNYINFKDLTVDDNGNNGGDSSFKGPILDTYYITFIDVSIKGSLVSDLTNKTPITSETLVNSIYYIPSQTEEECYKDTVDYSVFKRGPKEDCAKQTLTFIVCGLNCASCDDNPLKCTTCETGYSFLKDNVQKCVKTSDYLSLSEPEAYYLTNNHLYPCYTSCSKCSDSGSATHHKCDECKTTYPFFSYDSVTHLRNCYKTCKENGLWQENYGDRCVNNCDDTSTKSYKYETDKICMYNCTTYGKYFIEEKEECVDSCPSPYNYIIENEMKCVKECSSRTGYQFLSEDKKYCLTKCPKKYYVNEIGNKQCLSECGEHYPYSKVDSDECLVSCSSNLFYVDDGSGDKLCVDDCAKFPDLYEMRESTTTFKKCTTTCGGETPYMDTILKKCVSSCTTTSTKYHNTNSFVCISACPSGTYETQNYECVSSCPATMSYIDTDEKTCVANCDGKYISPDKTKCLVSCSAYDLLQLGTTNQCAEECNEIYPLFNMELNQCVGLCEAGYYELDGKYCVSSCARSQYNTKYFYKDGGKCVDKCGPSNPYLDSDNNLCVDSCARVTGKPYALPPLNMCVADCDILPYQFKYDYLCVENCHAPKQYSLNKKCVDKCDTPSYTLISGDGTTCVSSCSGSQYFLTVDNKYCSDTCPISAPFLDTVAKTCNAQCDPGKKIVLKYNKCVSDCDSSLYPYEATKDGVTYCTDNCGEFNLILQDNGKCGNSCTDSNKYVLPPNNTCVSECEGIYKYKNEDNHYCTQQCTGTYKLTVEGSNQCYANCPDIAQYQLGDTNKCVSSCEGTFYPIKTNQNKCVYECSGTYKYLNSARNECYEDCYNVHGEYFFGDMNQCVTMCDTPFPYLTVDNHTCVYQCDSNLLTVDQGDIKQCVDSCPAEYIYKYNGKCVSNCKDTLHTFIDNETKECIATCDPSRVYEEKEDGTKICYLSDCPRYKPMLININHCVNLCGGEFPYLSGTTCVANCGENQFVLKGDNVCLEKCEDGPAYYYNTEHVCVYQCDGKYPYLLQEKICVASCGANIRLSNDGKRCIDHCPSEYPFILPSTNRCVSSCSGTSTPYKSEDSFFCTTTCPNFIDIENHFCVQLCPHYAISVTKICVDECPSEYPYLIERQCYNKCESPYIYTDQDNYECLSDCQSSSYEHYLTYKTTCVKTCPKYTVQNGYQCIFDLSFEGIEGGMITSNLTKEEIIEILDENIKNLLDMNMTLKGEDFFLEVYNSSSPLPESSYTSSLNFSQCESILREKYHIPSTEEIIIAKIDTKDNIDSSKVDYKAYTESGEVLDTLPCKSITSSINTPLLISDDMINEGYEMYLKGIDIFNPNDDFYNNVCGPYVINDTDVCLYDRRKMYYNSSIILCEEGCSYIGIDYTERKVKCDCDTKTSFNLSSTVYTVKDTFLKKVFHHNLSTLRCYELFFNWNSVKRVISFWSGLLLSIITVSFGFIVYFQEIQTLFNKIELYVGSSPTINNGYFPKSQFVSSAMMKTETEAQSSISSKVQWNDSLEMKLQEDEIQLNNNNSNDNNNYDISFLMETNRKKLDSYPFYIALNDDTRSLFEMFLDQLKANLLIVKAFTLRSSFEIILINISQYLFYLVCVFMVNTLLYTDGTISNRFKNKGYLSFACNLLRGFLSLLISILLYKLICYLSSYAKVIETMMYEIKTKKDLSKLTKRVIPEIRKRLFIYFIIEILLMLFSFYYLTLFNVIYPCCKQSWFIGCICSLIMAFIFSFVLSIVIAVLRYLGIKWSSQNIYNISLFLQKV